MVDGRMEIFWKIEMSVLLPLFPSPSSPLVGRQLRTEPARGRGREYLARARVHARAPSISRRRHTIDLRIRWKELEQEYYHDSRGESSWQRTNCRK